ncbi:MULTISPECIES: WhiB family transcriptional regulator [Streptomyces]|uniref:WhiB family transcriptional regulator n=1 Tax=Streptomyces TaxID=1883 RepID=UPI0004C20642|nr:MULTISPECIES: WhiB family transcriptional regulator [Streptomyces]KOT54116.1 transcription factor WhiB [Streptomyces rimosus subsp. rimosus]
MEWWEQAACLDEDPELFFPVGVTGPAAQQQADAKAVCRQCPVTSECLEWALETGQNYGIWGGTDEEERRKLRSRRQRKRWAA